MELIKDLCIALIIVGIVSTIVYFSVARVTAIAVERADLSCKLKYGDSAAFHPSENFNVCRVGDNLKALD